MNDRLRYRLGLRSSNAARPYRNRAREAKVNPPWEADDFHDMCCGEELCDCPDDDGGGDAA